MNEENKEKIENIKKLLIEDNLTYSGQLRFLAYTVKLEEQNKDLKDRIDKAIEYIDRMTRVIDYNDDELITWEQIEDIEKILRGEDK